MATDEGKDEAKHRATQEVRDILNAVATGDKNVDQALDEMDVDALLSCHHPFADNGV